MGQSQSTSSSPAVSVLQNLSPTKARARPYERLSGIEERPPLQPHKSTYEMSERIGNGNAVAAMTASALEDSSSEYLTDNDAAVRNAPVTDATRLLPFDDDSDSDEELMQGNGRSGLGLGGPKKKKMHQAAPLPKESFLSITLQIFFPFLIAGMGMVGAGLVLDVVQHWEVFDVVNELFILVPALLGLKGNLEMTLASRLSTHANLGNMDTREETWSMVISNLALVQCQAIVVGALASLFAVVMGSIGHGGHFDVQHGFLLCASSLVTASVASFSLGLVMVAVILASRKLSINPDNVATPIAASLGDLITLALLSWISSILYADLYQDKWLAPLIIAVYVVIVVPLSVLVARANEHTLKVLREGWVPVLMAMVISSGGGVILDRAVSKFKGIAVFQPVMNGVGGNLVAVQASRMSTFLHAESSLGVLPPDESKICLNPFAVFCGRSIHARTARILLMMVVPGHLLFTYAISLLEAGHTSPTPVFLAVYLCATVIQLWTLLHTANWLINWMWTRHVDPDNSAIPYLTALGDLLGGLLLFVAFMILYAIGDKDADVGD